MKQSRSYWHASMLTFETIRSRGKCLQQLERFDEDMLNKSAYHNGNTFSSKVRPLSKAMRTEFCELVRLEACTGTVRLCVCRACLTVALTVLLLTFIIFFALLLVAVAIGALPSSLCDDFKGSCRSGSLTIIRSRTYRCIPSSASGPHCGPCTRCSGVSCSSSP